MKGDLREKQIAIIPSEKKVRTEVNDVALSLIICAGGNTLL